MNGEPSARGSSRKEADRRGGDQKDRSGDEIEQPLERARARRALERGGGEAGGIELGERDAIGV